MLGADDYTKRLHFTSELDDGHKSPFGTADSWFMDTTKAQQRGFAFRNVTDWFVPLVRDIAAGRA
ncbi:hypothetical protein [Paenibacillus sp. MER TA 81-3]|uniref:hypothetical protein n=1 Tax=Paenibacillus sp. MER TA 81-3 TaxID=2939573 RepID=UPI002889B067|nr:hypothetical protein [Paenibacillus sp. MER TA 81-3]